MAREVEANLAVALKTHGTRLASLGRRAEALAVTDEAVAVLRRLSGDDERFLPTLAGTLPTLGRDLTGRPDEAVAAVREGVAILRRLAAAEPSAYTPASPTPCPTSPRPSPARVTRTA